jgi:hypothetical protein
MDTVKRAVLDVAALVLLGLLAPAATGQVELHLFGKPFFGGAMTLSVTAPAKPASPVVIAYGLGALPLDAPIATSKGPLWIGTLLNVFAAGVTDASGRLLLPFVVPAGAPGLVGAEIVVQGYVQGPGLSNPGLLRLDEPSFQPSGVTVIDNPQPTEQALFGDRVAVGDLNDDGFQDIVASAWFEDYLGIDRSGRVYVMWGPDFQAWTPLQPSQPKVLGVFGADVKVADLDGDGIDDLVVGETTGDPPVPGATGSLHVYIGGRLFSDQPAQTLASLGTGIEYTIFGKVQALGDFDDDGHVDIAAGVLDASVGGLQRVGRVDVYWGPGFAEVGSIANPAVQAFEFFGGPLVVADVTGEGIDDLVVGVGRGDVGGLEDTGVVRVFSAVNRLFTQVLTLPNPSPGAFVRFGEGVNAADLDGDGLAEILGSDVKNRFAIFWSPAYAPAMKLTKPLSGAEGLSGASSFGYFHDAGDVNGDGVIDLFISDVFAGALSGCGSFAREGTAFLVLGPYYSTWHVIRNPDPHCADSFSWAGVLRDMNGDGSVDLVVPAHTVELGSDSNAGRVFVLSK